MFTLLNMGSFKDRLVEAVADAKMTTAEARAALAKLGMTRSNLTHWFGGRAINPSAAQLAPAAQLLGVNAVWLARGEGLKRPTKGDNKNMKLMQLSQDAVDVALAYDAMEPHVQELIRRHMRDVNEALGSPSAGNPFGKGPRHGKKSVKTKRKPGTQ